MITVKIHESSRCDSRSNDSPMSQSNQSTNLTTTLGTHIMTEEIRNGCQQMSRLLSCLTQLTTHNIYNFHEVVCTKIPLNCVINENFHSFLLYLVISYLLQQNVFKTLLLVKSSAFCLVVFLELSVFYNFSVNLTVYTVLILWCLCAIFTLVAVLTTTVLCYLEFTCVRWLLCLFYSFVGL